MSHHEEHEGHEEFDVLSHRVRGSGLFESASLLKEGMNRCVL